MRFSPTALMFMFGASLVATSSGSLSDGWKRVDVHDKNVDRAATAVASYISSATITH
jgi:hypothetical protein